MKFQCVQLDVDRFTVQLRETPVRRKQGHLSHPATLVFDHIDGFHPRGLLPVIDLPEVKNLPLDDSVVHRPVTFNNAPIAMFFSVLESWFGAKKHTPTLSKKSPDQEVVGTTSK
jgi:hypothetical protein